MSGLKIDVKNEKNKTINIIRIVAIYISIFAVCDVYFRVFKISAGFIKPAVILLPVVILCYFTANNVKHLSAGNVVIFGILAIIFWINKKVIIKGSEVFIQSYTKLNNETSNYDAIAETKVNVEFFFALAVIMIILALIFAIPVSARSIWILPLIMMLVPVFLVSCTGFLPSISNMCELLIAGVIYMICFRAYNNKQQIIALVGSVGVLILVIAVSSAGVPKIEKYKKDNFDKYKEIRASLKLLDEFDIKEIVSKKIEDRGNYTKAGIGKGNLSSLSNCKTEGTEELEVSVWADEVTRSEKPSSRVYLKAYVGATYTGEEWKTLEDNAVNKLKKIARDEESQLELMNIAFDKMKGIDDENTKANNPDDFSIPSIYYINRDKMNIGINVLNDSTDLGYFPYNAKITDAKGINFDSYIEGQGRRNYSYQFYDLDDAVGIIADYYYSDEVLNYISSKGIDIFEAQNDLWKKYSEFVYEEYTDYPTNISELSNLCDEMRNTDSMFEVSEEIDDTFTKEMSYTLNPGIKPEDKDFVENFLESKKGFCVHFATTATLIYRKFGYAARYVEGYAIPPSAFIKQSDGSYKATVTDGMAHAWCEVFDEYLGWIQREHTLYYRDLDNFSAGDFKEPTSKENAETTAQPVTEKETQTKQETVTTVNNEEESTEKKASGTGRITKGKSKRNNVLNIAIYFIVAIFILCILCLLQCGIRINNKMRKFRSRKGNTAILCIYNEIYELCCFCGMDTKLKAEDEIFENMRQNYIQLSDDEWLWIYECVVRSAFSDKTPNKYDRRTMYQFMRKFKKQVWKDLSIRRKFVFKFIKAM